MIKRYITSISILFMVSCSLKNEKKVDSFESKLTNYFKNDSISDFIEYQGVYRNIKDSVFYNFIRYFGIDTTILNKNNLESINETKSFNFISDSSKYNFYEIKLKSIPSEVWKYSYGLLLNTTENKYCVIEISEPYVLDIGKDNFCIAGFHESDSKGTFSLYSLSNKKLIKFFETDQFVINKSSECLIYQPFQLIDTYEDFNNDGYLDLVFHGNYLTFCEGLEEGPNYYDGDPIKNYGNIKYVYIQKRINNTSFFEIDSTLSTFVGGTHK